MKTIFKKYKNNKNNAKYYSKCNKISNIDIFYHFEKHIKIRFLICIIGLYYPKYNEEYLIHKIICN
jgi:hypothetical protein